MGVSEFHIFPKKTLTYSNGRLVHRAVRLCEEDVHDDGDSNAAKVHAQSRSDKKATPKLGIGILNLLDTVFSPSVCKVHEQDQAQEQEQHGAAESDIIAPDFEESVRNQEGKDDKAQPRNDLRSPESILNRRATVFRAVDTEE